MTKTATTDEAVAAGLEDAMVAAAGRDTVAHDRAVTPVGAGRIRFKGHAAKAGYPFRVWDGQVQAFVDGEWVDAPDAEAVTSE